MSKSHRDTFIYTGGRIFSESGIITPDLAVRTVGAVIVEVAPLNSISRDFTHEKVIDLQGNLLLPGLCDAHIHLEAGGKSLAMLDLIGMNQAQIKAALILEASRGGSATTWFRAFNWEPSRCQITRNLLDNCLPNRPTVVHQRDLHGLCCNSLALQAAGINASIADPAGGRFGRDEDGTLNGLLYENAIPLLEAAIPAHSIDERRQHILAAQTKLIGLGVTAVSEVLEAGADEIYRNLDEADELVLFVDAWQRIEHWEADTPPPEDGNRYQLRTLKAFLDGSFGSRTAALSEPYVDDINNRGLLFFSDDELKEMISKAQNAGWRMALHAIGDRAIEQACRVLCSIPDRARFRHRIEHVEMLPSELADRLAEAGATASTQPLHLLDDQRWLKGCIGEGRCSSVLPLRSIADRAIPLAFGSDFPVVNPDPLLNLHAAIRRCGFGDMPRDEFNPAEALSPRQALRACTHGWAYAADVEGTRGAIKAGQSADFTVVAGVDNDLRDWSAAKVVMTVCGGVVVFNNSSFQRRQFVRE